MITTQMPNRSSVSHYLHELAYYIECLADGASKFRGSNPLLHTHTWESHSLPTPPGLETKDGHYPIELSLIRVGGLSERVTLHLGHLGLSTVTVRPPHGTKHFIKTAFLSNLLKSPSYRDILQAIGALTGHTSQLRYALPGQKKATGLGESIPISAV